MIINLTYSKVSDTVIEVMFHAINDDWFVALFPSNDVDMEKMKAHYIGRDYYAIKKEYEGRIYEEIGV